MKSSTLRFILGAVAIFPAITMCAMWSFGALGAVFIKGDLSAIPYGFPFLACLGIYFVYLKDTLKLYKAGN